MRFLMMVVHPKDCAYEHGAMPTPELIGRMAKFNDEMAKAGVLLDGGGLSRSAKSVRLPMTGKRTVVDGPFAEAKEVVGGYWLIQARDQEEAIAWAQKCPDTGDAEARIEIRKLMDASDFQEAAGR